jgi:uncharacterized Zn-finger protein
MLTKTYRPAIICNKDCAQARYLKDHMKTHILDRPQYICEQTGCDKTFGREQEKQRHYQSVSLTVLRVAADHNLGRYIESKFCCNNCEKVFNRSDILERSILLMNLHGWS